jgi:hypothetical protein
MTQAKKILNHILAHGSISQREAFIDYGVQSFTRRISDLRLDGWHLVKVRKHHPTTGQVYSRYYLRGTEPKTNPALNG